VTFFDDPLQAIRSGQIPQVPILLGDTEDDGTVFASFFPNISAFYAYQFDQFGDSFHPPNLTALYPGLNDTEVLSVVVRDVWFRWCVPRLQEK
jgi:carboxylesterase type B